jgi:hypothetical protein
LKSVTPGVTKKKAETNKLKKKQSNVKAVNQKAVAVDKVA